MGKTKSDNKKKKKKSSQLVIRIETGERDAFVNLCDRMDTTAAREIRRFMRDWVAAHAPTAATDAAIADPEPAVEAPVEAEAEVTPKAKPAPKAKRKAAVEATA